jgi:putative FmdB family regulatory protein
MPLYEYECAKCGERTEAIQRSGDPLLTVCPLCGGALRKLLSAPAFQFKGSGFYVTDYGKAGSKTGERTEEKEKSSSKGEEGKSGSESKGDSAGESRESRKEDSSKGKKDGATNAAPAPPGGESAPAPSKKKDSGTK